MRRLEMVHRISDTLLQFMPDSELKTRNLIADVLLAESEKYGMAPPCVDEDRRQAILAVYYGGYSPHKWDEDFEKDPQVVEAYNRRLARRRNK